MATKTKGKAVTGANAQAEAQQSTSKAFQLIGGLRERDLGWHDYKKAEKNKILCPEGIMFVSSYNKEAKKHTAYILDVASKKLIGVIGPRKDGSDIYMKTEIKAIMADLKVETQVATVTC